MSLRAVLQGKSNYQDIGLLDAINNTLQDLGIVETKKTFFLICNLATIAQNQEDLHKNDMQLDYVEILN